MKKMIFAVGALFFAFSAVNAQQDAPKTTPKTEGHAAKQQHGKVSVGERAKKRAEKLNAICTLTDQQSASIIQINTDFFTKQDQLVKSADGKDGLKALRKERNQKEMKVLTAAQVAKLKAYHEQQKQNNNKGTAPAKADQED